MQSDQDGPIHPRFHHSLIPIRRVYSAGRIDPADLPQKAEKITFKDLYSGAIAVIPPTKLALQTPNKSDDKL